MSIDFAKTVSNIVGANTFPTVPCPDQYVGCINGSTWSSGVDIGREKFVDRKDAAMGRSDKVRSIILILESPHKDEFVFNCKGTKLWCPIGPANGATGENIIKHMPDVLKSLSMGQCNVIVMNGIRYQCSLGYPLGVPRHREIRNEIFISCWNQGGETDFQKRLKSYYNPGDIIVNACTGEKNQKDKSNLKMIVESAIVAELGKYLGIEGREWGGCRSVASCMGVYHPSFWHIKCHRKPIWSKLTS